MLCRLLHAGWAACSKRQTGGLEAKLVAHEPNWRPRSQAGGPEGMQCCIPMRAHPTGATMHSSGATDALSAAHTAAPAPLLTEATTAAAACPSLYVRITCSLILETAERTLTQHPLSHASHHHGAIRSNVLTTHPEQLPLATPFTIRALQPPQFSPHSRTPPDCFFRLLPAALTGCDRLTPNCESSQWRCEASPGPSRTELYETIRPRVQGQHLYHWYGEVPE